MVYVLVPWVCFSVLFCLALMRAAVTPQPDFEEAGFGPASEVVMPSGNAVEITTAQAPAPIREAVASNLQAAVKASTAVRKPTDTVTSSKKAPAEVLAIS